MNIVESILLGIIQGLTEFLPVSSSGHIELGKALLDVQDVGMDYSILVHVATALSTVIVFRKDILQIFTDLFRKEGIVAGMHFPLQLILSAVPVAVVGLLFEDEVNSLFEGRIVLVGAMLLITAFLLYLTTRVASSDKEIGYKEALIIGVAQMFAIMPGISRSGATIATALLLKVDKAHAARFSFLMVLIPIFGKALLDIKDVIEDPSLWSMGMDITIAGFLASFISGLLACTLMLRIVKQGKLVWFSIYCVIVGLLAIGVGIFG